MLKFFQRIRQRLIDEGNLKRYLLYSIGEILLVVIGILIALQINNWSDNQKKIRSETTALMELRREFQANLRLFEGHLALKEDGVQKWKEFLLTVSNKSLPASQRSIEHPAPGTRIFKPSQNVFNQLLYTGAIDNIQNDSLRNLLASWITILDQYKVREENHLDVLNQFDSYKYTLIAQFMMPDEYITQGQLSKEAYKNPFYTEEEQSNLLLLAYEDLKYQNLLLRNHLLLILTIRDGKQLQDTFNQIIDLLDMELSNRK